MEKYPIEQYIRMLRNQGFGGMLVTDHDSYGGYRYWKKNIKGDKYQDFLVLKGIEYDTLDAGHILVIMPETIKLRLLELRGDPGADADPYRPQLRRHSGTGPSLRGKIHEFYECQGLSAESGYPEGI